MAIKAQCAVELEQKGADPALIADEMVQAWQDYEAGRPNMKFAKGLEKFFGERVWKNRSAWPWKDGKAPKPKREWVECSWDDVNTPWYQAEQAKLEAEREAEYAGRAL